MNSIVTGKTPQQEPHIDWHDFNCLKEAVKERAYTLFNNLPPRLSHEEFAREAKLTLGTNDTQFAFEAYRKHLEEQYLLRINQNFPILSYTEVKYTFDTLREEGFLREWRIFQNRTQLQLVGKVKQLPGGWIVAFLSPSQRRAPMFRLWRNVGTGSFRSRCTIPYPIYNTPQSNPGVNMHANHNMFDSPTSMTDTPSPLNFLPYDGLYGRTQLFDSPPSGRCAFPVVIRDPVTGAVVNFPSPAPSKVPYCTEQSLEMDHFMREQQPTKRSCMQPRGKLVSAEIEDWNNDMHDVWPLNPNSHTKAKLQKEEAAIATPKCTVSPLGKSLYSSKASSERVIFCLDKKWPAKFKPRFRNARARFEIEFNRIVAKGYHLSQRATASFQLHDFKQKLVFRAAVERMEMEEQEDKSRKEGLQKAEKVRKEELRKIPYSEEWTSYCLEILKDSDGGQGEGKIWYSEERKMPVPFLKLAQMKEGGEPVVWCEDVFDKDAVRMYLERVLGVSKLRE
ncbi:MAG: hypothetical protein MMC33_003445 [Icmadophila ericetorum]|nr:hypothetical protein [Icmadophila ericetorum]